MGDSRFGSDPGMFSSGNSKGWAATFLSFQRRSYAFKINDERATLFASHDGGESEISPKTGRFLL
jgi:hypothetical protein